MSHPASEGLRMLADKLDQMAKDDGVAPFIAASMHLTKADFSVTCRRLDLVTKPIKDDSIFVDVAGKSGELQITGFANRRDMCVKKTVMKAVEVWVCGDEDVAVSA